MSKTIGIIRRDTIAILRTGVGWQQCYGSVGFEIAVKKSLSALDFAKSEMETMPDPGPAPRRGAGLRLSLIGESPSLMKRHPRVVRQSLDPHRE